MSFRSRLRLFFVLIVILPMLSVAIILFRLISDSETGKADAALRANHQTAVTLYGDAVRRADRATRAVGRDRIVVAALMAGDAERARRRAAQMQRSRNIRRVALSGTDGAVFDVGDRDAVAPSRTRLQARDGRRFGLLEASTTSAERYMRLVRRVTGMDVVVRVGARTAASTLPDPPELPRPGGAREVAGGDYRGVSFVARGVRGERLQVALLNPDVDRSGDVRDQYLVAIVILLGFLVLALTFALAVSRSLQRQIGAFLNAARRLGGGDFTADVPTPGHDEFAELGEEFNKMSRQLAARVEDLRAERARLESSLHRIGESFASNLDRDALIEIVVRTAVDGVEAEGGRACVRPAPGRPLEERARAGDLERAGEAIREAEAEVLRTGGKGEAHGGGAHALAHALHGANGTGSVLGVVSVARRGSAFTDAQRELFGYLAAQAAVSIENVGLHETVQRQAVTDELTGLYNHRRFQEAMEDEAERARRFGQAMGLVMLDIDDFKKVNDTYGHQQGDLVLAEVARILRESSREIDAPARYGGEELAVVLPQTDLEGAYNLAERVRAGIEGLQLPLPGGHGTLQVTASLGVASLPDSATDARQLLARADAALYEAKRSGKNKVVRAG
jgi:diguanylate cyclase (GGDEF)-like protein